MHYNGLIDKQILVKLTTRERPTQALKALRLAKELAVNPTKIKWLISLDLDDNSCNDVAYCDSIAHIIDNPFIVFGQSKSKIDAINRDMDEVPDWHILVNLSDDQTCVTQGWDDIIRKAMPNDLDASLWYHDQAQPRINTQEIIGYNYYKRTGYIYHPAFKSFYCDNLATDQALKLGKMIKSDQCLFRHDHPACNHPTSLQNDALYDKNQKAWFEDKATYERLKLEL